MKRRFFLFAAPAIVAAPSLMRVSTAAVTQSHRDILLKMMSPLMVNMRPRVYFVNLAYITLSGLELTQDWFEEVGEPIPLSAMKGLSKAEFRRLRAEKA